MRSCVIFNPAAKGEKAQRFRRHLDTIAAQATLKLTTAPGDARRLAAEAVAEGFDTVVAAGGDGTINEVLNGLGDAPSGFECARLAVLPLGTVNVFARELALPTSLELAWTAIRQGRETCIDLPRVEYSALPSTLDPRPSSPGARPPTRRYFAQLAGAGLDGRAIELVNWELKKKLGALAYVLAGFQAMREVPARITATTPARFATGGLVLIGNGRLYGGRFRIFPKADLRDGRLEVCVFPRVNWLTLAHCGPHLLLRSRLPDSAIESFQAESLTLTSPTPVPLELDGELVGHLPATFAIEKCRLRVVVP